MRMRTIKDSNTQNLFESSIKEALNCMSSIVSSRAKLLEHITEAEIVQDGDVVGSLKDLRSTSRKLNDIADVARKTVTDMEMLHKSGSLNVLVSGFLPLPCLVHDHA
mgnify:CR=1 FL=1